MPYPASYDKQDIISAIVRKHKQGKLKSGSGHKAKSRKQAIAIALSEARKYGK